MRVQVTVKVGDINRTSRTQVPARGDALEVDPHAPFETFSDAVEMRVQRSLAAYDAATSRTDTCIYLRPTAHAAQKDLKELTNENYAMRMAAARALHEKRRKAVGPFVCEVFVFVQKHGDGNGSTSRRATASRIATAAAAVGSFLRERPQIQVGEIARTHWAVTQARQPDGHPVDVPASATFRQMQHLDTIRAQHEQPLVEPEFGTVTVRINGSSELELAINIRELRRLLGLPSHNLLVEGIFSSFVPPEMPDQDVLDVDHESEEE